MRSVTIVLNNLGNVAYAQRDFERAAALHEENIAVRRALGDRLAPATVLGNLGQARKAQGDLARAQVHLEEALGPAREVAARQPIADTLTYLTDLRLEQGDLGAAGECAAEALAVRREVGNKRSLASALGGSAQEQFEQRKEQEGDMLRSGRSPVRTLLYWTSITQRGTTTDEWPAEPAYRSAAA